MTDKPDLSNLPQQENGLRRFALDIGPVVIFFLVNKYYDNLMWATASLIAATLVSVALTWVLEKRVSAPAIITAVVVSIFGGLTLYFDDSTFIKMKPTIVNCLFSFILLGGLALRKSVLKMLMGSMMPLRDEGWKILTWSWIVFFFFLAGLNEYIWRNFDEDFWVSFKLFGMTPLTMVFTMAQIPVMLKYQLKPASQEVEE